MQNLFDMEEKVFFECQNILESISKITTKDELLLKQELCYELTERIAFLKLLEKNKDGFISSNAQNSEIEEHSELSENEMFINDNGLKNISEDNELEEVIFNNQLNQIHTDSDEINTHETNDFSEDKSSSTDNFTTEIPSELTNHITINEQNISFDDEKTLPSEDNLESSIITNEDDNTDILEEESIVELLKEQAPEPESIEEHNTENINRGKIVEFDEKPSRSAENDDYLDENSSTFENKKVQLTPIKGIKIIESLFDDDPLERVEASNDSKESFKSSIPEEANSKKNIEFRLDMNDKIAFSRFLFGGSQSEMNETINILNSFKNLEQAKQYLSDMYYDKHWDKADEYAQRLWLLVENKFL